MVESLQKKLGRVRPPRVHVTYEVETGGAIELKELPFVVGILADLAGKPLVPLLSFKNRKFAEIDRDNFSDIMASLAPRVAFMVPNHISKDTPDFGVDLTFKSMDDFNPLSVVKNLPKLAKMFESRSKLNDLLAKLEGNEDLERMLMDLMANKTLRDTVKAQLQGGSAAAATPAAPGPNAGQPTPPDKPAPTTP